MQTRLQLHTPLQSLSGRLDLALAQIELRKSLVPARPKRQGAFYNEGESDSQDSDDSDEDDDDEEDDELESEGDLEIEGGNDSLGDIEDVRLESRRETESRSAGDDEGLDEGEHITLRSLGGRKARPAQLAATGDSEDE